MLFVCRHGALWIPVSRTIRIYLLTHGYFPISDHEVDDSSAIMLDLVSWSRVAPPMTLYTSSIPVHVPAYMFIHPSSTCTSLHVYTSIKYMYQHACSYIHQVHVSACMFIHPSSTCTSMHVHTSIKYMYQPACSYIHQAHVPACMFIHPSSTCTSLHVHTSIKHMYQLACSYIHQAHVPAYMLIHTQPYTTCMCIHPSLGIAPQKTNIAALAHKDQYTPQNLCILSGHIFLWTRLAKNKYFQTLPLLYLPCSVLVEGDDSMCPDLSVEVQALQPFNKSFSVSVANCPLNCEDHPSLINVTLNDEGFRVSFINSSSNSFRVS